MTHTKEDFIRVCNEVLNAEDLNKVERIHSYSFWIDLMDYLKGSEYKKTFKDFSHEAWDNIFYND